MLFQKWFVRVTTCTPCGVRTAARRNISVLTLYHKHLCGVALTASVISCQDTIVLSRQLQSVSARVPGELISFITFYSVV